jgi:NAD+ kinase
VQIGISGTGITDTAIKSIKKELENAGIQLVLGSKIKSKNLDCIIVLGGDRGVRNYFHKNLDSEIPVLGISESESNGFLAQIDLKEFSTYVNRLKNKKYEIEEVPRIGVKIASKSATLMEYTLRVNGEEVWHDSSDGVIISTPIGSSAYSMSAGGPVIFQDSSVFGIISVNSLDVTRRPLIVSNESLIEIGDISSRLYCEVVLDGIDRYNIDKIIECTKKRFNCDLCSC